MSYDFDNKQQVFAANGAVGLSDVTYEFDVNGREVGRLVDGAQYTSVHTDSSLIFDTRQGAPSAISRSFLYADQSNDCLAAQESGTTWYFHNDRLLSPSAVSSSTSALIEYFTYSSAGEPIGVDASGALIDISSFGLQQMAIGHRGRPISAVANYSIAADRMKRQPSAAGFSVTKGAVGDPYDGGNGWT